ncbi:AEC family transporter [soil metagenome]
MTQILDLAFPFFALILFGFLAARVWGHGEAGLQWLNIFLIWFALPALIFLIIADAPFEKLVDWPFITATTAVTAAAFLTVFSVARLAFKASTTEAAIQSTSGSYGNVGYMGLPLAVAFFGPQAAVPAALVFCFDCTLQFTLTAFLATLGHAANEEAHWGKIVLRVLWQVFGHPFIIATILGAIASAIEFKAPGALGTILRMLMNSAGPVALFAIGVTVGLREVSKLGPELPFLVAMKVLLQPLLAFAVMSFMPGLDPLWRHVAIMMAALPTASNAFILASQYRTYVAGASTTVIITTVISAFTIPLIVYLIQAGLIP